MNASNRSVLFLRKLSPVALLLVAGSIVIGCAPPPTAEEMAQKYPIIDTHIDVPYRVHRNPVDVGEAATDGQFDYPRAVAGGLNAPFMSIYIPAAVDEAGEAYEFAESAIAIIEELTEKHPSKFALATCSDDIEAQMQAGAHVSTHGHGKRRPHHRLYRQSAPLFSTRYSLYHPDPLQE